MTHKMTRPADEAGQAEQKTDAQLDYRDFLIDHPEIHAIICHHAAKPAVLRDIEKVIARETGNHDFAALCATMLKIKFKRIGGCCA